MSVNLSPVFNDTQFTNTGALAVGYKIYTYAEGSSTPLATYTTSSGAVPQANPIILNARGEAANQIWLTAGLGYKLVLTTDTDVVVRTEDNIRGVNDTSVAIDQWIASGIAPTYVSPTQFTLPGDQTSNFQIGRRVKASVTAGTVYGTILTSAYTSLTTVTLVMDGSVLDNGLSSLSYGLITTTPNSLPNSLSAMAIQSQAYTAYTSSGTAPAFAVTAIPNYPAFTFYQTVTVRFHAANAGVACTLSINGAAAVNIKQYDATGAKVDPNFTANQMGVLVSDGVNWVLTDPLATGLTIGNDPTVVDNSSKAASTSWIRNGLATLAVAAGFTFSFSVAAGYLRFPTWFASFIIEWGATVSGTGGNTTITFPLTFPNALLRQMVSSPGGNVINGASGGTTTSFNCATTIGATGAGTAGSNLYWFAIGY